MPESFLMPKLGLTMEAGKILQWLVDDGAEVSQGQPLLVIETDKVESEVESTGAGVLHRLGEVGTEYPCGEQIGWLLAPGESAPAGTPMASAPVSTPAAEPVIAAVETPPESVAVASTPPGGIAAMGDHGRLLASPNAKRLAKERGVDLAMVAGTGPGGRITSEDVVAAKVVEAPAATPTTPLTTTAPASAAPTPTPTGTTVLATAAARQLAELIGIDLSQVASSGPDPRVSREDVAAHIRALLAAPSTDRAAAEPAPSLPLLQDPTAVTPMSGMRGTIASRMADSLSSMAQLTLHMDVDMDAVVEDRAARKAAGAAPGYTDYVIAAAAAALVEHPYVNSQVTEDGVAELPGVNVGMAVAIDGGLIVPVVHDVPSLSLDELAKETTRLAAAARDRKLGLAELEGGTFSVTALGMFDVDGFTPIVNAPNTAILGVGRLRDDTAWTDYGTPYRVSRLTLSLTWDHRAFDGAPAAEFCRAIKHHLESVGS